MPSSLNALIAAWAISLIIVLGTTLVFEMTYDPDAPEEQQSADQTPATGTQDQTADTAAPEEDTRAPGTGGTTPDQMQASNSGGSGEGPTQTPTETPADTRTETPRQDPATGLVEDPRRQQPEATQTPTTVATIRTGIRIEADPALLEQSNQGPLPKISEDGRRPFEEYAAPAIANDPRPKIAIVITDLGQRSRMARRAISDLPPGVTFAFSPYASNLMEYGEQSRRMGHEVLLMIPMEPVNYPQHDPGPFSLLTSRSARENISLMRSSLGRMTGYVGVVNHMGDRFTAATDSLKPILEELQRRGLMFLDARETQYSVAFNMAQNMNLPSAYNNRFIDDEPNAEEIANQLAALETRARTFDYAVGLGRPYPVTMDAVKVWAAGLEDRGFVLVPISATANQQPLPR